MTSKQFYLLGEDPSTAKDVEIPPQTNDDDLRHLIASYFAVVEPKGLGFASDGAQLISIADVLASKDPVAVTVDGKAVREVPGPQGLPYVGNYFEVYPDHLGNHQRLFEKYGPLFKTTNMGGIVYHTNEPTLASMVFAESEFFSKNIIDGHPLYPIKNIEAGVFLGDTSTEEWKTAHKFLPPAFGPKAVRHYAPTMEEAWNVYPYMLKLGAQAVGKLVLGLDFKHFTAVDAPLHEMVLRIAQTLALNKKITSMGSWYAMLPFGDPKRLRDGRQRIVEMVNESIEKASKGVEDLELQEAALKSDNMVDYILRATDSKGNKLPKGRIMEPLVVDIGAGFTTTSSLLSWLLYGLVAYPGNQERLLQELIDNDFDENTQITADLTSKLNSLDKYIKETQRRHNPSYQPARTSKVDMILPGGYKLPRDSIVIPAIHHIHNNSKIWDNPALFDPDRWDTEKVKTRPNGSYIPFATGPRSCIGFNFALQEVKIFLPKLVYRYNFSLAKEGLPNNLYVRAERRIKWPPKSE
ncbi:cytochrome P450 monooxygenase [Xylariales sp. AK1849]|nr:cytochrome P450 monooxygenase [Xylariales sp. AK1849]